MKRLLLLLVALVLLFPTGASAHASEVAPLSACPYQTAPWADGWRQKRAMICLVNYYRDQHGLAPLSLHVPLMRSSQRKANDLYSCGFSHTACGRPFTFWPIRMGYTSVCPRWSLGENLAATYDVYTARANFHALSHSTSHATNMRRRYKHIGVGFVRSKNWNGQRAVIFVQHFGWRPCA